MALASHRVSEATRHLPAYARIRALHLVHRLWTVADGILTPTLKVKRQVVGDRFSAEIDALYAKLSSADPADELVREVLQHPSRRR